MESSSEEEGNTSDDDNTEDDRNSEEENGGREDNQEDSPSKALIAREEGNHEEKVESPFLPYVSKSHKKKAKRAEHRQWVLALEAEGKWPARRSSSRMAGRVGGSKDKPSL